MTPRVVLLDTMVPTYAFGADHALLPACQGILADPARLGWTLAASTELLQEFTFHRLRRHDPAGAVQDARALTSMVALIDFDIHVLDLMLDLIEHHTIRGRDAAHAATALTHGITTIVSTDRAFDAVPGLARVDPAQL